MCDLYEKRWYPRVHKYDIYDYLNVFYGQEKQKSLNLFVFCRIFDYYKLSNILTLQASAYQNILSTFRPHPEYFKVSFIGASYPLFVRNKEFIYRGLDFEKIADFVQRISTEFPQAKINTKVEFISKLDSKYTSLNIKILFFSFSVVRMLNS